MEELVHVQINSIPNSVHISDVGVSFTADIPYDDWFKLMATISRLETAMQFAIGDALNYGQRKYGEKYAQAMEATGHSYQALANYAWVSNAIPMLMRQPSLSWTHHRVVARLEPSEQGTALMLAQSNDWTVDELSTHVKGEPVTRKQNELVRVPEGMTPHEAERLLKNANECESSPLCERCPYK